MVHYKKILYVFYFVMTGIVCFSLGSLFSGYIRSPVKTAGANEAGEVFYLLGSDTGDPGYAEAAKHLGHLRYGIVFDAGSSGSRVHVYKFVAKDGLLLFKDEMFRKVEPGLSYYADDPVKSASTLEPLLAYAQEVIPREYHGETPVFLRATAGLRLIGHDKADDILNQVRKLFAQSVFKDSAVESAKVMDGVDEGLFAWVTVNYLMGRLGKPHDQTVGILDLGGGSTQIAFAVSQQEADDIDPLYILTNVYNGHLYNIYVHSYLKYGLNSARETIFGTILTTDTTLRTHECLPVSFQGSLYGIDFKHDLLVSTLEEEYRRINELKKTNNICNDRVKSLFDTSMQCPNTSPDGLQIDDLAIAKVICTFNGVPQPKVDGREFYGFSFYYDKAVDFNLMHLINQEANYAISKLPDLPENEEKDSSLSSLSSNFVHDDYAHYKITPNHYKTAAYDVCSLTSDQILKRFAVKEEYIATMCADNMYIYHLLNHFGFDDQKSSITITKKVNGAEAGWCLGAILDILMLS